MMLDFDLFFVVFGRGFGFVQFLQVVVVVFVEVLGFGYWQLVLFQFGQCILQGVDGMFEYGGVGDVELQVFFVYQVIGGGCFLVFLFGQVDIDLVGEVVVQVLLVLVMV